MIPGAGQVGSLTGLQPFAPGPVAKRSHRGRDLGEVGCDWAFQIVNPTLAPPIDLGRREPSHADHDVYGSHELMVGQCGFGRLDHPIFELASNCSAHGR